MLAAECGQVTLGLARMPIRHGMLVVNVWLRVGLTLFGWSIALLVLLRAAMILLHSAG